MNKSVNIMNGLSLEVNLPSLITILGSAASGKTQMQYKFITDYSRENLPVLFINTQIPKELVLSNIKRKLNIYKIKSNKNIYISNITSTSQILDLCNTVDFKAIFIDSSIFLKGDLGMYNSNKRVLLLEQSENKLFEFENSFNTIREKKSKVYDDLLILSRKTNAHIFITEGINRVSSRDSYINFLNIQLISYSDVFMTCSKTKEEYRKGEHRELKCNVTVQKNRYGYSAFSQKFII